MLQSKPIIRYNLEISGKYVSLQCVFHSIRFKVNKKDWLSGIDSLFLCLPVSIYPPGEKPYTVTPTSETQQQLEDNTSCTLTEPAEALYPMNKV